MKAKKVLNRVILYFLVLVIIVVTLAPYLWLVISSISTKIELMSRQIFLIPHHITFVNYKNLMSADFIPAAMNSIIVTSSVVVISVIIGVLPPTRSLASGSGARIPCSTSRCSRR